LMRQEIIQNFQLLQELGSLSQAYSKASAPAPAVKEAPVVIKTFDSAKPKQQTKKK